MNQDTPLPNLNDAHVRLPLIVEVMALEAEPNKEKRLFANTVSVADRLELLKFMLNPPVEPEVTTEVAAPESETLPEPLVEIPPEPPPLTRYTRAGKWFAGIVLTFLSEIDL